MIAVLLNLLGGLVGWLVSHLPASPFSNLAFGDVTTIGPYTLGQIMSWVNWLIPVGEMMTLFNAWLLAVVTASAVLWISRHTQALGRLMAGG